MGGVPCIRGLRIPVVTVIAMYVEGMRDEEILELDLDLEAEDLTEAVRYAIEAVNNGNAAAARAS